MVANFAAGGAAINVLAREAGARLVVVDAGVAEPCVHPEVRSLRLGPGTANIAAGPAMTREQAARRRRSRAPRSRGDLVRDGFGLIGIGEMGIANTTSAGALCACLLPAAPAGRLRARHRARRGGRSRARSTIVERALSR